MTHYNKLNNYPNRHRNHEIETLSERFFKTCFPESWIINPFHIDYGTDYNCEITTEGKVLGNNFSIQLKGKVTEGNNEEIKIVLKRTNINRWLNKLEPTMIIVFIVDEKEAYWTWFENNTVDLTQKNETFTIGITRQNKLSEANWGSIAKYVQTIFSKRHLLYDIPEMNGKGVDGWKAFFDNSFEKALSIFYDAITQKPQDTSTLQGIALSEYNLFNYQKALIYINKAIEIDSSEILCLNKASILTEQGFLTNDPSRINEAIKIYEKLISNGYRSSVLFYNYGSALTKLKEYEKSITFFKKSISLDPNKPEVWNNLGNSYMYIGDHFLEMQCYDNALQINPNLAEALFSKGSSLFRYFGNAEEGLQLMLKATQLSNRHEIDNPYVYFWIAEAYLWKKDFENSSKWNEKGLTFFLSDSYLLTQKTRLVEMMKHKF